ncbi:uncharacterized protein LOC132061877 [Lycium ferocissimum]|uniref:uncharacterized protein LOC132061877 n=1 Tax=Lycium ferocissimum TaxID=112874 RepID=UPI002815A535|nr:uncharacterized protein LOC132061877 [Lycium ferocissimum]
MWGKHGINKVAMMQNGIVMVRFDSAEGKNEVIQGGIYHVDNKPLIVKAWESEMEFTRDELYSGLSKLGSLVGKPLMVDRNIEKKMGLNFARLLVEVKIDTPLPDVILFKNERGNVIEQRVTYDWKPTLCKVSQKYGHNEEVCRRNKKEVKPQEPHQVEAQKPVEAVQEVGKDKMAKGSVTNGVSNQGGRGGGWRQNNQGGRGGGWRKPQTNWQVQRAG